MQNAFMPSEWTPELSIVSETNTCSIDSVLLESIKQNENVKRAYGRMFAYDVPVNIDGSNHKANVISYEANRTTCRTTAKEKKSSCSRHIRASIFDRRLLRKSRPPVLFAYQSVSSSVWRPLGGCRYAPNILSNA